MSDLDEMRDWFERCLAEIGGYEGHIIKSLMLMQPALTKSAPDDLTVFDGLPFKYCEENASPLFEKAAAGDADAANALRLIAGMLIARDARLPIRLATFASETLLRAAMSKPSRGPGRFDPYGLIARNVTIIRAVE